MIHKNPTFALIACFFLVACSGTDQGSNERIGSTAGAVIGAVVGSRIGTSLGKRSGRILGASLGAIFGSMIGKEISRTLSQADIRRADKSAQKAMETGNTGKTVTWNNPDTGNSGTYKPISDRKQEGHKVCRDFESAVVIDGEKNVATGRACRQPDGSWKIVK